MNKIVAPSIIAAATAVVALPVEAGAVLDPIFAAIEAHKSARAAYVAAEEFEDGVRTIGGDVGGGMQEVDRTYENEVDAACALVSVLPTTMAGVMALLRYAIDAEKDCGEIWPHDVQSDDGSDIRTWHYFLIANLAEVLPGLTAGGAPGAPAATQQG